MLMKRQLRRILPVLVLALTGWLLFDNVFSDDAPIRALAEKAACTKKKCEDQHGLVKMQRMPWGQTIDYQWRDGTIAVSCRRAYIVFGERQCTIE